MLRTFLNVNLTELISSFTDKLVSPSKGGHFFFLFFIFNYAKLNNSTFSGTLRIVLNHSKCNTSCSLCFRQFLSSWIHYVHAGMGGSDGFD